MDLLIVPSRKIKKMPFSKNSVAKITKKNNMKATKNTTTNFINEMVENQTKVMDTILESTKTFTKDIPFVKENLEKGEKVYKDALKNSTELLNETTSKVTNATEEAKKTSSETNNFFKQWLENSINTSKQNFEKTFSTNKMEMPEMGTNPTEFMNNMTTWMTNMNNNMMSLMSQVNNTNNWMNNNPMTNANNPMLQMMNNFKTQNNLTEGINSWTKYTKPYFDAMTTLNADWAKNMPNTTSAESFKGMHTMTESLGKFYEMWSPLFEKMKEGNFTLEMYRKNMKPEMLKDFMDKFFNFMPADAKANLDKMTKEFAEQMKQYNTFGTTTFQDMKNNFASYTNTNNSNANVMEMYTSIKNAMATMVSPLTKLLEDNNSVKGMINWSNLSDKMMELNIKNNQLQNMMYNTGAQAMEQMAENVIAKTQAGEDIESIIKLYQEFMTNGDKQFTNLFESDEYSKLMTEVSSLQMHIKMEMDNQMEKTLFSQMPIATKSEMNEVYKNIYDLKKTIRNIEKVMGIKPTNEATVEPTPTKATPVAKPVIAKNTTPAKKAVANKVATPTKKVVAKKVVSKK